MQDREDTTSTCRFCGNYFAKVLPALFRAYIDFYKSSIPETQYQSTFDRLIDPAKDLHCLVLRTPGGSEEKRKLFGIAHFYPHQTPWSEKPIMHLNGKPLCQRSGYDQSIRIEG
jgi:hypothetical protein